MGVSTFAAIRGLSLQSGTTYYATVQAIDFTGKSSYAVSRGITIDTTDPRVEWVGLRDTTQFQNGLRLEWDLILDAESDIVSMEWGLGSRPGSADVTGWEPASLEANTGLEIGTAELGLYQGQVIFATLKVTSIVPIITSLVTVYLDL